MARDYQSILDYVASLQQPEQPQQQMLLDSELPGPQPATGPQTGGGAQGLLDVLGAIGSGLGSVGGALGSGLLQTLQALPEVAAYRQAALGQPEALKVLQEQRQQRQAMESLSKADFGELTPQIQEALKLGGVKEAQRIAAKAPSFKAIQDVLKQSSLAPELKKAIQTTALIDPKLAFQNYFSGIQATKREELERFRQGAITERSQVAQTGREKLAGQKQQVRKEELAARQPGNVIKTAVDSGILNADDPNFADQAMGYLLDQGIKLPQTPDGQKKFIETLLQSPRLPKAPAFIDQLIGKFGFGTTKAQPAQQGFSIKRIE